MVATIAGNGLGLDNTSLQKLGGSSGGTARTGQGNTAGYVNLANGNLVLQGADEGLVFAGTQLSFIRTYNSQGQMAGHDWRYGFSQAIGTLTGTANAAGSSVVRTASDGSQVTYNYDAGRGLYVSASHAGTDDTLAWDAGAAQWTWKDGQTLQQETYNRMGRNGCPSR
jgi:large repetitive protein